MITTYARQAADTGGLGLRIKIALGLLGIYAGISLAAAGVAYSLAAPDATAAIVRDMSMASPALVDDSPESASTIPELPCPGKPTAAD